MNVGPSRKITSAWRPSLRLMGAWTLLDVLFNLRFPGPEPALWYLLPSLDATALVGMVAMCAGRGRRAPRALIVAAAVLVVAVRLFRIGDGVNRRYFNRPLTLGLDLPLAMDLIRLLGDTVSHPLLLVALPVALGVLVGIGALAAWALRAAERALSVRDVRAVFAGLVATAALASLATLQRGAPAPAEAGPAAGGSVAGTYVAGAAEDQRRSGAFGASALPRLLREADFAAHLSRYRDAQAVRIEAAGRALAATPHDLAKLKGAPIFVFIIESYGAVTLDQPDHAGRLGPVWDAAAAALEAHGFTVASSLLDSPTYAGRSWLAHTTLTTGVRTTELVTDSLIQRRRPATLARFFHDAGYRTVLVQPANHFPNLVRWLYDFDTVYSGWDFDYRGPTYRWANMPDQYVIDFVHRREVTAARAPLLAVYTLITSHAPWSDQPPVVSDWASIGDGAVYRALPVTHFPVTWINLGDAAEAYDRSVAYDIEVITAYANRVLANDALVIVLGDHQPVAEVTRFSNSMAVPIHVLSRNAALVAPFRARGYTPGLRPARTSHPPAGMETFLPDLLADLSGPSPAP
jgi:hypothetical protein